MAGKIGYELTYILRADGTDDQQKTFLEKLKGIIQAHDGEVIAVEDWGRRRLAYPIHKENRGVYTYILFTGNNALVAELERNLRINEQVLRFLSVKICNDYDTAKNKYKPTTNLASASAVSPVVTAAVQE
jgi:small subunit ribosomal protein S6